MASRDTSEIKCDVRQIGLNRCGKNSVRLSYANNTLCEDSHFELYLGFKKLACFAKQANPVRSNSRSSISGFNVMNKVKESKIKRY